LGVVILGVDPGLSGALALVHAGRIVDVIDTPIFQVKGKRLLDVYGLARWLDQSQALHAIEKAVVEEVGAMPGQGVTSMFSFGHVYGAVRGVIAAHFIPMTDVRPNVWKKHYRLSQDKDASRRVATATWPTEGGRFARVKDDGRAEACLLALWASQGAEPDFMK
jgi:crossover junction endodeoxyribonuclease RuvC